VTEAVKMIAGVAVTISVTAGALTTQPVPVAEFVFTQGGPGPSMRGGTGARVS